MSGQWLSYNDAVQRLQKRLCSLNSRESSRANWSTDLRMSCSNEPMSPRGDEKARSQADPSSVMMGAMRDALKFFGCCRARRGQLGKDCARAMRSAEKSTHALGSGKHSRSTSSSTISTPMHVVEGLDGVFGHRCRSLAALLDAILERVEGLAEMLATILRKRLELEALLSDLSAEGVAKAGDCETGREVSPS